MRTISLFGIQTRSACTVVSLSAIKAILALPENPSDLDIATTVNFALRDAEDKFSSVEDGKSMGMAASVAHEKWFGDTFENLGFKTLTHPAVTTESSTQDKMEYLKGQFKQPGLPLDEFQGVFGDQILELFEKGIFIETLNESTREIVFSAQARPADTAPQSPPAEPLAEQFKAQLEKLNNTGMLIDSGGHIVSITKKDGLFYCYNSYSSALFVMSSLDDAIKWCVDFTTANPSKDVQISHCIKKPYTHVMNAGHNAISDHLMKWAVIHFFKNYSPGLSSFWRGKDQSKITIWDLIDHARGMNRKGKFFVSYTGAETEKHLKSLFGIDVKYLSRLAPYAEKLYVLQQLEHAYQSSTAVAAYRAAPTAPNLFTAPSHLQKTQIELNICVYEEGALCLVFQRNEEMSLLLEKRRCEITREPELDVSLPGNKWLKDATVGYSLIYLKDYSDEEMRERTAANEGFHSGYHMGSIADLLSKLSKDPKCKYTFILGSGLNEENKCFFTDEQIAALDRWADSEKAIAPACRF